MKKKIILTISILIIFIITLIFGYKNYILFPRDNIGTTNQYIEIAQQAIREKGPTTATKFDLAEAYLIAGQYEYAINLFKELAPEDARSYWGMALAYDKLKNYKEVLVNIDLLLKNPPKLNAKDKSEQYTRVYMLEARAHLKLHQYKQWLDACSKVLQYQ